MSASHGMSEGEGGKKREEFGEGWRWGGLLETFHTAASSLIITRHHCFIADGD